MQKFVVNNCLNKANYTVGLLLDAAATTAVEQVADQVNEVINTIAKKQGYKPTWRFSPGYGNWPLEIQPQLANIIKTELIGLQVTENYLLFPRKSVTAIIGLMPANEDLKNKNEAVLLVHNKTAHLVNYLKKQLLTTKNKAEEDSSKTTADVSGIAMKGQPTE